MIRFRKILLHVFVSPVNQLADLKIKETPHENDEEYHSSKESSDEYESAEEKEQEQENDDQYSENEGSECTSNSEEEEEYDDEEEDEDADDDDDDDDDTNWVTPSNITNLKRIVHGGNYDSKEVIVGCMSTDFAVQVSHIAVI